MSPVARGIAVRIATGAAGALGVAWFAWGSSEGGTSDLTWLPPWFPTRNATPTEVDTRADVLWSSVGVVDGYARGALGIACALVLALVFAAGVRELLRRHPHYLLAAYTQRDALKAASILPAALAAVAAAVGEELCFRGLLARWLGLTLCALAFGLIHRLPSAATWAYRALAVGFGLVASALVYFTGQLASAIAFHAAMNLLGLAYLWELERPVRQRRRDQHPTLQRRAGGQLGVKHTAPTRT
jgi:membrane protease YdiL (CAAX protease family)